MRSSQAGRADAPRVLLLPPKVRAASQRIPQSVATGDGFKFFLINGSYGEEMAPAAVFGDMSPLRSSWSVSIAH